MQYYLQHKKIKKQLKIKLVKNKTTPKNVPRQKIEFGYNPNLQDVGKHGLHISSIGMIDNVIDRPENI